MEIEVNGKTYRLHFKRKHVYQAGMLADVIEMPTLLDGDTGKSLLRMYEFATKLLLVGLQKYHSAEFRADFDKDYSKQLGQAEDLLDDYLEQSEVSLVDFANELLEALISRGIV